jgi:ArsR family transcriptional regulator, arsenate/arsenite/antimonite-responsive transcriptional repressor / arsenate reductase (thioredoxin)
LTVYDSAHEQLAAHPEAATGRPALHWSIPDPVRIGKPVAFERVVDELGDRITRLTPVVQPIAHPSAQADVPHEHRRAP